MSKTNLVEAVDENDKFVGLLSKQEIKRRNLGYRLIAVFLLNKNGDIFIQKRHKSLKRFPLYYESSAGGHVEVGESYLDAAKRELQEELNLSDVDLKFLGKRRIVYDEIAKFVALFVCVTDKMPNIDRNVIEEGRFFTKTEIELLVKEKEKITPVCELLLKEFYL